MKLIEELQQEHDLIERVAGAFLTFTRGPIEARSAADGQAFLRFFRRYANDFHHAREEDVLLAALRDRAGLPGDRGPIKVVIDEHAEMGGLIRQIEQCLLECTAAERGDEGTAGSTPDGPVPQLAQLATQYVHALWHHIDAENSVLFPESATRLRWANVPDLPSRPLTDEEAAAMADGQALCGRYAPTMDDGVIRGDGCVMCPAFGTTCRGLEAEWWNEWEWDEFDDRMSNA